MAADILMPITNFNLKDYQHTYDNFSWDEVAQNFSWHTTGKVNMAYEAIDKHVEQGNGKKIALHFTSGNRTETYTYLNIMKNSNKMANILTQDAGVERGDHVFIFMPRGPEMIFSMLGIMKAGAVCAPMFEAFMESAVRERLLNGKGKVLITTMPMLSRIPMDELPDLETVYIVNSSAVHEDPRIRSLTPLYETASDTFDVCWMEDDEPMLLCYTSGSTGNPKGILHTHKGIMTQAYQTGKWVLDLKQDDVYWCTADPGWITGAVYGFLTPWLHGVEAIMFGGRFNAEAWLKTMQDYRVTIWYSAPTVFRLFMGLDPAVIKKYDTSSLRNIYSVGEPLNPEAIRWGMREFGLRIHDTWFMTETGGQMICNYPSMPIKLGSMGKPFPGVEAVILDDKGNQLGPNQMGTLAIRAGWPSMMVGVWGSESKYQSYFENGWYISGDTAYYDEDGYFFYQGRIDDVINTSGERVGPFEVESKLLEHRAVAESGVIGKPDATRGEIIKAFVVLTPGYEPTEELQKELRDFVKLGLAAHAAPREFQFCDTLPKTRSGKIMRRVLKAMELGLPVGDLSTMADD
ncbi:MAG: acetate--CoA ligase [Oscillospiraceae bacterium]|nr:acetate--CoA ligase [Oscillospiraceae bacterium]